jgi:hypothetical protein
MKKIRGDQAREVVQISQHGGHLRSLDLVWLRLAIHFVRMRIDCEASPQYVLLFAAVSANTTFLTPIESLCRWRLE